MTRGPSQLVDDVSFAITAADIDGVARLMLSQLDDEDRQRVNEITAQISEHRDDLAFSWDHIGACPVLVVRLLVLS